MPCCWAFCFIQGGRPQGHVLCDQPRGYRLCGLIMYLLTIYLFTYRSWVNCSQGKGRGNPANPQCQFWISWRGTNWCRKCIFWKWVACSPHVQFYYTMCTITRWERAHIQISKPHSNRGVLSYHDRCDSRSGPCRGPPHFSSARGGRVEGHAVSPHQRGSKHGESLAASCFPWWLTSFDLSISWPRYIREKAALLITLDYGLLCFLLQSRCDLGSEIIRARWNVACV